MAIFDYNPSAITPFPYWKWNKVLPAVYDDSVSQYEMLCRLLSVVNNIIESTNSTGEQVEALTQLVQQLIDGGFPSGLVEYVNQIVDAAMADDIERINAIIDEIRTQTGNDISAINQRVTELSNYIRDTFVYNVLDYGATGNGTTDDTKAIQAAFDACTEGSTVLFPFGRGQTYRVTNTISITKPYIRVIGLTECSIAWQRHGIKFEAATADSILFNVGASGVTFNNIIASSTVQDTGIFAFCKILAADTDVNFNSCDIVYFRVGIIHYNRGLKVINSIFSDEDLAIDIYSDNNIDSSGSNTMRGIYISGNRFHYNNYAVRINNSAPNGMMIINNSLDFSPSQETGNIILDASTSELFGCEISGNTALDCGGNTINIRVANNCKIANNIFNNRRFVNNHEYIVIGTMNIGAIIANSMGPSTKSAIKITNLNRAIISNNICNDCAQSATDTSFGVITIDSGLYGAIITNNMVKVGGSNISTNPIIINSTSISNTIITNNTSSNQSYIVATPNNPALNNCKISMKIID